MKKPSEGRLSDRGEGIGTVTREMVVKRARQIALLNGRSENEFQDSDFNEAKRELLGEDEVNPEPTAEEKIPEDQRWDPVPGSEGHKVPNSPAPDEQSVAEKLYDEGVADAELDQAVQATKDDLRREKE
ncbi:MAG TPA: hypothetical protein VG938_13640 [Verrucomicrobiae bacterium]|jgi:hypothetical protein|nr:hypothetical protein [Verrucomicrobiae bacterium]